MFQLNPASMLLISIEQLFMRLRFEKGLTSFLYTELMSHNNINCLLSQVFI